MNKKKELNRYIIAAIVLTSLPIIIYVLKFWRAGVSNDAQAWSSFADYLTGVTAPALAILNLIVLVRLTLSISDYDNQRMLTELRFDTYKDFMSKLNEVSSENFSLEKINSLSHYLENYSINNFFLLEGYKNAIFSKIHIELYELVYNLKLDLEEYNNEVKEYELVKVHGVIRPLRSNSEDYIKELKEEIENYIVKYDALKVNCSGFLHRVVLDRSVEEYRARYLRKP